MSALCAHILVVSLLLLLLLLLYYYNILQSVGVICPVSPQFPILCTNLYNYRILTEGYSTEVTQLQLQVLIKADRKSRCLQYKKCWLIDWYIFTPLSPLLPPSLSIVSTAMVVRVRWKQSLISLSTRCLLSTVYSTERPGLVLGQCQISTPAPVIHQSFYTTIAAFQSSTMNSVYCFHSIIIVIVWREGKARGEICAELWN